MSFPMVDVNSWNYVDGYYTSGGKRWSVARLIKLNEDTPIVDIPVCALARWYWPWEENMTLEAFIEHAKRVKDADLNVPIMISPAGGIVDGVHRICKAIIDGHETIKAKILSSLPHEDGKDE